MSNSPQSSMTKLFKGGNYATVALKGSQEKWQTCAALGLIGKTQEALEGLSHFNANYNLDIQTAYPWLQLFDEIIVTDPSEWQNVRQLVKASVFPFPKLFGLPESLHLS